MNSYKETNAEDLISIDLQDSEFSLFLNNIN